jgi:hypothetical protein
MEIHIENIYADDLQRRLRPQASRGEDLRGNSS